jgi:hypothetical protein
LSAAPTIEATSRRLLFDKIYKIDANLVNLVNPVKKLSEFYSMFDSLSAYYNSQVKIEALRAAKFKLTELEQLTEMKA